MRPVIYTLTFDDLLYVGATHNPTGRRRAHMRALRKGRPINKAVGDAYAKHGRPTFTVVASVLPGVRPEHVEAEAIRDFSATLNTNQTPSPIPLPGELRGKSYGPYANVSEAAHALGVSYDVLKKLARRYSYDAVVYKLAYTALKEEPFVGPPHPKSLMGVECLDGVWDYRKAHIQARGISQSRWSKLGFWKSIELGPYKPPPRQRIPPMPRKPLTINVDGVDLTLADAAVRYGVSLPLVQQRRARGLTGRQCVGLDPTPRQKSNAAARAKRQAVAERKKIHKTYEWNGMRGTMPTLCREAGVSYSAIRARMDRGLSFAEAVDEARKFLGLLRKLKNSAVSVTAEELAPFAFSRTCK